MRRSRRFTRAPRKSQGWEYQTTDLKTRETDGSNKQQWLESTYKKGQERPVRFSTVSDLEVEPLYTPDDVKQSYDAALGYPGEFPYTRGVYESMYRGRLWTMRQFAGFGLAE